MRIVLADDEPRVRLALRLLLEQQPGINVIAEADNPADLLVQVKTSCPEVVLVDWGLLASAPQRLLTTLRHTCPLSGIVIMSGRTHVSEEALTAGADDFVLKVDPPERLLCVLRKTAAINLKART